MTGGSPAQQPIEPTRVNHRFHTWGFVFLFGFLIPTLALQGFLSPEEGSHLLAFIAVVTAPVAWWLLIEARFKIVVSERGISARSFQAEERDLAWAQVGSVRYSPLSRVLEIRGRTGGPPIRVSLLRENVTVLARVLSRRVPPGAFEGAARELFRVGG